MTLEPGEAWTRRALEDLREAGYRPGSWARFLTASFVRAREVRAARPELARQTAGWSAAGLFAGGIARELAAASGVPAPRRGPALAWWATTGLMLDWHLGMVEGPDGKVRSLSPADALTLGRLALVPFAAAAAPSVPLFVALLAAAATTDVVDGPLARRAGPTRLGRDLDYTADVAFVMAATTAARRARWLPGPAATLIAVRAATPIVTLAVGYFRNARRPSTEPFGDARWASPLPYASLAASALSRRRLGPALAAAGSLGALASYAIGAPRGRASKSQDRLAQIAPPF
jgi:phosphatidylglycerophosphate synthase